MKELLAELLEFERTNTFKENGLLLERIHKDSKEGDWDFDWQTPLTIRDIYIEAATEYLEVLENDK